MAAISGRDFEVTLYGDVHLADYFPSKCETEHGGHDLSEPRRWMHMFGAWWLERECSRCGVTFHAGTEE